MLLQEPSVKRKSGVRATGWNGTSEYLPQAKDRDRQERKAVKFYWVFSLGIMMTYNKLGRWRRRKMLCPVLSEQPWLFHYWNPLLAANTSLTYSQLPPHTSPAQQLPVAVQEAADYCYIESVEAMWVSFHSIYILVRLFNTSVLLGQILTKKFKRNLV